MSKEEIKSLIRIYYSCNRESNMEFFQVLWGSISDYDKSKVNAIWKKLITHKDFYNDSGYFNENNYSWILNKL